jgi:ABC-type antimicrobial peptide transport system permease subunit
MLVPGLVLGTAGALMLTGLARGILFGLTPTDPAVFAIAASILTMAAVVAAWFPARRASQVDPLIALRHE